MAGRHTKAQTPSLQRAGVGKEITRAELLRLKATAVKCRLASLEMAYRAGSGHIPPDFSCMDIMVTLFFRVLRLDPFRPDWDDRDRFILSKGHAVGALYACLAERGFFPKEWLDTYQQMETRLPGHPDRNVTPGVEHNTGALGHGLSVACGLAAGLRLRKGRGEGHTPRVYVLLGDGELQEGSNWEAAMFAAQQGLDNLVAVVDRNRLQQGDFTERTVALEDLAAKWSSFGWDVAACDGHDIAALVDVLEAPPAPGKPRVIIANTVKGRGGPVMENKPEWHHRIPTEAEYEEIKAGLSAVLESLERELESEERVNRG